MIWLYFKISSKNNGCRFSDLLYWVEKLFFCWINCYGNYNLFIIYRMNKMLSVV